MPTLLRRLPHRGRNKCVQPAALDVCAAHGYKVHKACVAWSVGRLSVILLSACIPACACTETSLGPAPPGLPAALPGLSAPPGFPAAPPGLPAPAPCPSQGWGAAAPPAPPAPAPPSQQDLMAPPALAPATGPTQRWGAAAPPAPPAPEPPAGPAQGWDAAPPFGPAQGEGAAPCGSGGPASNSGPENVQPTTVSWQEFTALQAEVQRLAAGMAALQLAFAAEAARLP